MNKTEIFTPAQIKKEVAKTPEIEAMKRILSENGYIFKVEHKFSPDRQWRFDIALLDMRVAIEYEGLYSKKSRHTTISGFTADTLKYNAATVQGWKVLRYTTTTYLNLKKDLELIKK